MKYEDLEKVNNELKTIDVKGKNYVEVNQRIKAFRMLYPEGFIDTEMLSNENGVCVFKAIVGYYETTTSYLERHILGTGTAYEKEGSTFINKTSYIENCETSAVGRALGMAGFGIDTSIASAEEVQNAIVQQDEDKTISETKEKALRVVIENNKMETDKVVAILKQYGYKKLSEIKMSDYMKILQQCGG